MVRAERFELPTFWFVARRSIQLSYARMRTLKDYQTGSKTPSFSRSSSIGCIQILHGTPLLVRTDFPLFGQFCGRALSRDYHHPPLPIPPDRPRDGTAHSLSER